MALVYKRLAVGVVGCTTADVNMMPSLRQVSTAGSSNWQTKKKSTEAAAAAARMVRCKQLGPPGWF